MNFVEKVTLQEIQQKLFRRQKEEEILEQLANNKDNLVKSLKSSNHNLAKQLGRLTFLIKILLYILTQFFFIDSFKTQYSCLY